MEKNIDIFIEKLASKAPTPGGGGVAALCGAMGSALASMVCNLTIGKQKYKEFEAELIEILADAEKMHKKMLDLAQEDEVAFEPLSRVYSLPAETEEQKAYKEQKMEECLVVAADVPFRAVKAGYDAILLHEKLVERGSRLAISDVGVGAVVCRAALESAALNVYINTKFMKNRQLADDLNAQTEEYVRKGAEMADKIYSAVADTLK